MNRLVLNGRVLALVALFGIAAVPAMGDPVGQAERDQATSQPADMNKPPELTPSQLIAQDFQTIAQDHATVGSANPVRKDQGNR